MLNSETGHERSEATMDMLSLIEPASTLVGFDYSSLPDALAQRQQDRASRIARILRTTVEAAGEIGRELLAAQSELEHGQFLQWVERATGLSKSTAYRFMDIAGAFGERLPTVGSLPLTVVQKLAEKSTPEPVRVAVLTRIEAGETVQPREILEQVRVAKDEARKVAAEEKEAARREAMTPEQREEEDALASSGARRKAARARKEEQIRREQQKERDEREALAAEAAGILVDALGEDAAAEFFARFERVHFEVMRQAELLAHIRRAEREPETEIRANEVERHGALYGFLAPGDRDRVEALAREIESNGLSEPLLVRRERGGALARAYPYRLLKGHDEYRALTEILGRQVISVRIAPPVEVAP